MATRTALASIDRLSAAVGCADVGMSALTISYAASPEKTSLRMVSVGVGRQNPGPAVAPFLPMAVRQPLRPAFSPRHTADAATTVQTQAESNAPLLWLAAWHRAETEPLVTRQFRARAWAATLSAGDEASVCRRVAHVEGLLAPGDRDLRSAARHFTKAAKSIPAYAPCSQPASATLAAHAAQVQVNLAPVTAVRGGRPRGPSARPRNDVWAGLLMGHTRTAVTHQQGPVGRVWRRTRGTLAGLDNNHDRMPPPLGPRERVRPGHRPLCRRPGHAAHGTEPASSVRAAGRTTAQGDTHASQVSHLCQLVGSSPRESTRTRSRLI